MTYEYAIRKMESNPSSSSSYLRSKLNLSEHIWHHRSILGYDIEYVPVSKEVAQADHLGARRLLDVQGVPVTGWTQMEPSEEYLKATKNLKVGSGEALKDSRGNQLAAGDYAYIISEGRGVGIGNLIRLAKVMSFTPKKVKLVAFPTIDDDDTDEILVREPPYVVKVAGLVIDEPTITEDYGFPVSTNGKAEGTSNEL